MRTLYVSYDGLLEPIGQSQILPYLEGLARQDVRLCLLSFEKAADLARSSRVLSDTRRRLEAVGIRWVALRYHKRPPVVSTLYDLVRGVCRVLGLAHRHRSQVLHTRSYVSAAMSLPARWGLRVPLLFDIRGFWVDERVEGGIWRRGLLYRLAKRVEVVLFRNADAIVSLTHAGERAIRECAEFGARRVPPVPIAVVPTCVDTERFAPRPRDLALTARLGLEGRTVFTYVGSVGTWYAMDEVLDFFGVAREQIGSAALLLIVRGQLHELRAAVARRGLDDIATITADVSHQELPVWLSVSHVGLAFYRPGTSNVARFPTKIGEYLASGLPVVVSGRVGDCDAFVEQARVGVSVREFTTAEYEGAARRLRELLADDGLADRARRLAVTELSVAEGVRRYGALYRQLVQSDTGST